MVSELSPNIGPIVPVLSPSKVAELECTEVKQHSLQRDGRVVLPQWAVAEASRYFDENLLLEDFRPPSAVRAGDSRASACAAHFRSLVENWRPHSADFWKHCQMFSKQWAPAASDQHECSSPRSRPLSAGRLTNYLTRLSRSTPPETSLDDVNPCGSEDFFPPEVWLAAKRFGIKLSDIRVTCDSIFEACRAWTGLDWGKDGATDPCPWPVPPELDGLRCSWRALAAISGQDRVYLNPPWSKLDVWLYKAVCECRQGLPILAIVPGWLGSICSDIEQFVRLLDQQEAIILPQWQIDIKTRILWDAEFAHPATGDKMPPLNVQLVWLRPIRWH